MNTVKFESFNSTPPGSEEAAQATTETAVAVAAEASSNTCTPVSTPPPPPQPVPACEQVQPQPQPILEPLSEATSTGSLLLDSNMENDKPELSNMSHSTSNPVAGAASAVKPPPTTTPPPPPSSSPPLPPPPPPASGLKVFSPVISQDTKTNHRDKQEPTQKSVNHKKVPMVVVPMADSYGGLMAIPLSTLDQLKDQSRMNSLKDEQQARDLLVWNEGIGTLYGCDLRFKLNQLGCLELLDSDDETENTLKSQNAIVACTPAATTITKTTANNINTTRNAKPSSLNNSNHHHNHNNNHSQRHNHATNNTMTNGVSSQDHLSTNLASKTAADPMSMPRISNHNNKKNKQPDTLEPSSSNAHTSSSSSFSYNAVRQISPGSSLLRDGPNMKRPKYSGSSFSSSVRQNQQALAKKLQLTQNSIVLEKLVSKQKLDEIKATNNVEHWSTEDVKKFVDCIPGCAGHGELFESQQICGKSLMYLDQKDLLDVINVKLGPAVKIYHAISLLK